MKQYPNSSTLKMEATDFSVRSTDLSQTTRRHIPVIYVLFAFERKTFFFFSFLALTLVKKASCTRTLYFEMNMLSKLS